MKVDKIYIWFSDLTYVEQHKLTDKYFDSINPSRLTREQVLIIYIEEKIEL